MPWSSTSPMWKISAEDILGMLKQDYSQRAEELRMRADELLAEINTWSSLTPPTDEDRKSVIARVMTLYRETHEYIAGRPKRP